MISCDPVSSNILCQISHGKSIMRYNTVSEMESIGEKNKGSYHT